MAFSSHVAGRAAERLHTPAEAARHDGGQAFFSHLPVFGPFR